MRSELMVCPVLFAVPNLSVYRQRCFSTLFLHSTLRFIFPWFAAMLTPFCFSINNMLTLHGYEGLLAVIYVYRNSWHRLLSV